MEHSKEILRNEHASLDIRRKAGTSVRRHAGTLVRRYAGTPVPLRIRLYIYIFKQKTRHSMLNDTFRFMVRLTLLILYYFR